MTSPRRRSAAALINLLFPGAGYLYAGRPVAAVVTLTLTLFATHLMVFGALHPPPRPVGAILLWAAPIMLLVGLPILGWLAASTAPKEFVPTRFNRWWVYCLYAVAALWLANANWLYLVRPQLRAFRNPSGSMEPTLLTGDFFYMGSSRHGAPPPSGAVIVFASVEEPDLQVVKRVVGLPGDTLAMKLGRLYRNAAEVPEPYIKRSNPSASFDTSTIAQVRRWQRGRHFNPADSLALPGLNDWGPFVVPPDSLFVLGDNRDASYDSRFFGFVPIANTLGRPKLIYYSFDTSTKKLWPFLSAIRWSRLGMILPGNN